MAFKKWVKYIIIFAVISGAFFQFFIHMNSDYDSKPSKFYISEEFYIFHDFLGGEVSYFDRGMNVSIYSHFSGHQYNISDVFGIAQRNDWVYLTELKRGRHNVAIFCKGSLSFQVDLGKEEIYYGVYWVAQTNLPESCRLDKNNSKKLNMNE